MARSTPIPATEVPGGFVTSALWNAQVGAALQWFFGTGAGNGVPRFRARASTGQAFASSTNHAPVNLDEEDYDSEGGHSTTTNPSRYTCQVPGIYRITAQGSFTTNATGGRCVAIMVNGGLVAQARSPAMPAGQSWVLQANIDHYLNIGDYVEVGLYQNSGSSLTTATGVSVSPMLMLWWLGNN